MLVDLKIDKKAFVDGADALILLYESIGWDKAKQLEPSKITISEHDSMDILDNYYLVNEKERGARMILWLNYGPSSSKDVPPGKIKLEEGWMK